MCGQEIFIGVFDRASNTLVQYTSHPELDSGNISRILEDPSTVREIYDNADYADLEANYMKKKSLANIQHRHSGPSQIHHAHEKEEPESENTISHPRDSTDETLLPKTKL